MATTRNKVMWREGTLMRPHHLQQQQRYNDYVNNLRFRAINDLSWGFTELSLNDELLAQGKIMIDSASGTLPDGTVFSIPTRMRCPIHCIRAVFLMKRAVMSIWPYPLPVT